MDDTASRTLHRAREDRRGLARVPAFVRSGEGMETTIPSDELLWHIFGALAQCER
jgi:hypothetical protein